MTNAVQLAQYGSVQNSFKNRIINGAMVIDQRNAGAAVTVNSATTVFGVDRFFGWGYAAAGVFTIQQSTTAPAGFINSTKITVTTADASLGTTKFYTFGQFIEGYNIADLGWGAANASTVTLSFWVQSSITGTYSATLLNTNFSRGYTASFTINVANTWQQISLVIAGDTSGTWATNNTSGIRLWISLGSGSSYTGTANVWNAGTTYAATGQINLISTLSATMYITGVQLEKGSTATSFDYRPYGTELNNCFRYFFTSLNKQGGSSASPSYQGWVGFTDSIYTHICTGFTFPIAMRAFPSITIFSGSGNGYADGFGRGQFGGGFAGVESGEIMNYCANVVSARAGGGSNNFSAGAIIRGGYTANAEL